VLETGHLLSCSIEAARKQESEGAYGLETSSYGKRIEEQRSPYRQSFGHLLKPLGKVSFSKHLFNIRPAFVGLPLQMRANSLI
jgi:hypothetical protein